jgi:crotonobetainyl-CoA:carnitine CoA-transferase CaiB-like acyl-CoA transferase
LVISIQNEREWARFCSEVLQQPDLTVDPRFANNSLRVANRPQLDGMIHDFFRSKSRATLEHTLRGAGIAYGAVNSVDQLAHHPQLRLWPISTPSGTAELIAPPIQTELDTGSFAAVPALGEHTERIRREFG